MALSRIYFRLVGGAAASGRRAPVRPNVAAQPRLVRVAPRRPRPAQRVAKSQRQKQTAAAAAAAR